MNLKNYTSRVAVSITVSRIESALSNWPQITGLTKEIKNGRVVSVYFHTQEEGKTFTVRLPAQVSAAQEALWQQYCESVSQRNKSRADFLDQAERTAWKIMQDWVEVQIAMIRLGQVNTLQVFMGFVWDGNQTFYEQLRGTGFKQLSDKQN